MTLPLAPFGRTGHQSTRLIFGAAALGGMSQSRADATLDLIRRHGINHLDTAASYGASEDRLAPFLADHRPDYFLATKTGERTGGAARAELERSLERMGVEQVDLIQLHNLVEDDEWRTAFAPGGVVEALAAARDEGLVRFIGVTGHGLRIPSMHLRSLGEFDFDSVLFPYSYVLMQLPEYAADARALLERCAGRNVAVQTIKSIARRRWADDDTRPHHSWYEPLDDSDAIDHAVRWVLGNPQVFLNTTSDANQLPAIFAAVGRLGEALDDASLAADVAGHAMTPIFDGGELERI